SSYCCVQELSQITSPEYALLLFDVSELRAVTLLTMQIRIGIIFANVFYAAEHLSSAKIVDIKDGTTRMCKNPLRFVTPNFERTVLFPGELYGYPSLKE
ncbi:MAG: hypothetical protein ACTSXG_04430, partial [Alphaproteobacteria bacterium]